MNNIFFVPKSSNDALKKGIIKDLQYCFPNKDIKFLEKDLKTKKYDMFYVVKIGVSQGFLAASIDNNNDVYITHVCKTSSMKGVFGKLMQKVKSVYKTANKFYLKVREDNPAAISAYKKAGFRIRTNVLINPTKNKKSFLVTMNSTQLDKAIDIARNLRVGQTYAQLNMNRDLLRNALLEVTRDRWLYHKQKWLYGQGDDTYMQLIYGNLAVTMFIAINQYLDYGNPSVFQYSESPFALNLQLHPELSKHIGANYLQDSNGQGTHKNSGKFAQSYDMFKNNVYNKSFTELKKLAKSTFEKIYNDMISRETIPSKLNDPKTILNYINRNFTGRGNTDIMQFYTHNLGIYQFLSMYGYRNGIMYPFSGNCTVIAIFRISLYERLTQNKLRRNIQFVASSKHVDNSQEVCHYGLRTKNMKVNERIAGGNFQLQTTPQWAYLTTVSSIEDYNKIYDVLSANAMYRAKLRANRNQPDPSRKRVLNSFSSIIKQYMNYETQMLHNHRVKKRYSPNQILNAPIYS